MTSTEQTLIRTAPQPLLIAGRDTTEGTPSLLTRARRLAQSKPQASVVLINYNSGEWGARAAASVRAQRGVKVELIVIDNASTDDSLDRIVAAATPDRVIVNATNLGYAAAVNQGIRSSIGDVVLPLNSDAWLAPDYVRIGLDVLDRHPGVGVVGGQVATSAGDVIRGPLRVTFTMRVRELPIEAPLDCLRVDGSCALIRRAALTEIDHRWGVGGFDPRFFVYGETIDLAFKLRRLGWTTRYEPSMSAEHVRSYSSAHRISDKRGLMRELVLASRHINAARHSHALVRPFAHLVCLAQDVGFALIQVTRGDVEAPGDVIRGWRRALRTSGPGALASRGA
jgi:GT2 family glycosyltransferase